METRSLLDFLKEPTAPFREFFVLRFLKTKATALKIPHFQDRTGNLILGVRSEAELLKRMKLPSKEPLRVFVAHLDHPGFHGVKFLGQDRLEFLWHGGSPTAHLAGARVWLANRDVRLPEGQISRFELIPSQKALHSGEVHAPGLDAALAAVPHPQKATDLFGGLRFRQPAWQEGSLIYTHAADDVVGSYCAFELMAQHHRKSSWLKNNLVLLTRAEEVGYIGCIAHLEDLARTLKNRRPRELVYVSLETSRQIPPEAVLGAGPVVRLGDRSSVFHSGYTHALQKLAQRVLPKEHQVRVMNGGTCEASAILAYGHPAIGVSIPLGNYHNQSIEGGPDAAPPQGPAPEFVDERDVARLLKLCEALSQPQPEFRDPWKAFRQELRKDLKSYRPLLRSI